MTPVVERWNESEDGPLTEKAMRQKLEQRGYRVSRYVYPAGTTFPNHTHGVDKVDAVLAGRFRIELEGHEVILEPGDWVAVPKGAIHNAQVVGTESVVSLDAVRPEP